MEVVNTRFVEIRESLGLTEIVEEPTREGNTLYLILVTSPDRCQRVDVIPGISDHDAVCVTYEAKVSRNKKKPGNMYLFKHADVNSVKKDITKYHNEQFKLDLEADDTNSTWEKFKELLYNIMRKHIPQRTIRHNNKLPWVNTTIRRLTRRRKRTRAKAKKTMKNADWKRYHQLTKDLKKQLREVTGIFSDGTTRGINKKAWTYIKSKRRDNIGIPPLKNKHDEAQEKADILSQQYQSVFSRYNAKDNTPNPTYNVPSMPDINMYDNGILKLLRDINTQKFVGPDLIPNRVLKECCAELIPIIGAIFRKSLALGQLPSDLLKANVIGIYKKMGKSANQAIIDQYH